VRGHNARAERRHHLRGWPWTFWARLGAPIVLGAAVLVAGERESGATEESAAESTAGAGVEGASRGGAEPDWTAADPPRNSLSFWGHACCYLDIAGIGIVTDPVFDASIGFVYRRRTPAPNPAAYDQTEIILLSHAHRDHLSPKTLATFPDSAVILCSAATAAYLPELTSQIVSLRPGDRYDFAGGAIIAVAAHHPSGRNALSIDQVGDALGFVIETLERTIYYTGDSDYFAGFAEVGRTHAPDLVLLNLNAHLYAADAVQAVRDLGMPAVVPIHHGAFAGPNDLASPRRREELRASEVDVIELEVGETRLLDSLRLSTAPRGAGGG
jgi:L-ascorbate metabolism protein UlaG (beta-lactamase superfamily)